MNDKECKSYGVSFRMPHPFSPKDFWEMSNDLRYYHPDRIIVDMEIEKLDKGFSIVISLEDKPEPKKLF